MCLPGGGCMGFCVIPTCENERIRYIPQIENIFDLWRAFYKTCDERYGFKR